MLQALGRGHQGGGGQAIVRVGAAVSLLSQFLTRNKFQFNNVKLVSIVLLHILFIEQKLFKTLCTGIKLLIFLSYPVDCLEELDVHGVAGELPLYLDQGVTRGHGLHQEAVSGQGQRVGDALLELALPGLAHPRQVQVTLGQGPRLCGVKSEKQATFYTFGYCLNSTL